MKHPAGGGVRPVPGLSRRPLGRQPGLWRARFAPVRSDRCAVRSISPANMPSASSARHLRGGRSQRGRQRSDRPGCNATATRALRRPMPRRCAFLRAPTSCRRSIAANIAAPELTAWAPTRPGNLCHSRPDRLRVQRRRDDSPISAAIATSPGRSRRRRVRDTADRLPVVQIPGRGADPEPRTAPEWRSIGGIIYQVGGFYFKEELQRESGFFLPIGAQLASFLSYFGRDIDSESKSVFGQVEVPLGETLTAVGGLRYTDNKRERDCISTPRRSAPVRPMRAAVRAGPATQGFRQAALRSTAQPGQQRRQDHLARRAQLQAQCGHADLRQGLDRLQGRRLRRGRAPTSPRPTPPTKRAEADLRRDRPAPVQSQRVLLRLQGPAGFGPARHHRGRAGLQRRRGDDLGRRSSKRDFELTENNIFHASFNYLERQVRRAVRPVQRVRGSGRVRTQRHRRSRSQHRRASSSPTSRATGRRSRPSSSSRWATSTSSSWAARVR